MFQLDGARFAEISFDKLDVNDRMSLDVSIERNPEIVKAVAEAEANLRLKEKLGIRSIGAVGK